MINLIPVKESIVVHQGKNDHLINTVGWTATWKYRDLAPYLTPFTE